jgi:hypothetical protein
VCGVSAPDVVCGMKMADSAEGGLVLIGTGEAAGVIELR